MMLFKREGIGEGELVSLCFFFYFLICYMCFLLENLVVKEYKYSFNIIE